MTYKNKCTRFAEEIMAVCERHGMILIICDHGTKFCFAAPEEVAKWEAKAFNNVEVLQSKKYKDFLEDGD